MIKGNNKTTFNIREPKMYLAELKETKKALQYQKSIHAQITEQNNITISGLQKSNYSSLEKQKQLRLIISDLKTQLNSIKRNNKNDHREEIKDEIKEVIKINDEERLDARLEKLKTENNELKRKNAEMNIEHDKQNDEILKQNMRLLDENKIKAKMLSKLKSNNLSLQEKFDVSTKSYNHNEHIYKDMLERRKKRIKDLNQGYVFVQMDIDKLENSISYVKMRNEPLSEFLDEFLRETDQIEFRKKYGRSRVMAMRNNWNRKIQKIEEVQRSVKKIKNFVESKTENVRANKDGEDLVNEVKNIQNSLKCVISENLKLKKIVKDKEIGVKELEKSLNEKFEKNMKILELKYRKAKEKVSACKKCKKKKTQQKKSTNEQIASNARKRSRGEESNKDKPRKKTKESSKDKPKEKKKESSKDKPKEKTKKTPPQNQEEKPTKKVEKKKKAEINVNKEIGQSRSNFVDLVKTELREAPLPASVRLEELGNNANREDYEDEECLVKLENVDIYGRKYRNYAFRNLEPFPRKEFEDLYERMMGSYNIKMTRRTRSGKTYNESKHKNVKLSYDTYPKLRAILDKLLHKPEKNKVAILVYMRVFAKWIVNIENDPMPWREPSPISPLEHFDLIERSLKKKVLVQDLTEEAKSEYGKEK